ncbi:MAG TPA: hypothetical protein VE178_01710 [Silvibacterium sp.]|jgi:hypothetical protein|nr:hypothetical protein [Silvibacterium sp.]
MNDTTPLRLQVAGEALSILENTRHTKYQHDLFIDETTGTYNVDCSGLVSYILGRVAPAHLNLIPYGTSETRLLAQDYYTFFSLLPNETTDGWRQILFLRDARRGDLIAWALPPPNPDTGHIFFVAADPVSVDANTLAVPAYDASNILHYDDSRGPGQPFQTGVGSGTFRIQGNAGGSPVAFQFGPGDPMVPDNIAIGRIENFGG